MRSLLYPTARAPRASGALRTLPSFRSGTAAISLAALAALAILPALVSCGGGSEDPPADGPPDGQMDGPPGPRVVQIDPCPTSVGIEIIEEVVRNPDGTTGFKFSPNPAIIRAGASVRFRLGAGHNARSGSVFKTNPGKTECFRFYWKESLTFQCDAHGFFGQLIVQ